MSEYRTNNNAVPVNAAPLFASCWLALFNELRDNFYETAEMADASENLTIISGDKTGPVVSD